jgi:hypothetical protein
MSIESADVAGFTNIGLCSDATLTKGLFALSGYLSVNICNDEIVISPFNLSQKTLFT